METRFQTSFIPKKPMASTIGGVSAPRHHVGTSLFMTISTILFVISLAGAGGAYFYNQYLISAQSGYENDLVARKQQFNIDLIGQLKGESTKIDLAENLLRNHLALSQIFPIISTMTIEDVRFMSMDLSTPTSASDGIKVSMNGYGTSFSAVAFQSDVLNQLDQYGLRTVVKNPILSSPARGANGSVSFGFTATIDSASLSYEKSVSPASAASTTSQ
jgi:hypothetical protein